MLVLAKPTVIFINNYSTLLYICILCWESVCCFYSCVTLCYVYRLCTPFTILYIRQCE